MNATESLFSFLPESDFGSSFLQDIKWYKRSLFGKEFKKDVIENSTLADLVIGSNADPEWIRKKIVEPSAKEKYCPSFSASLYTLTVIAYELKQYSERRIVGNKIQQRFDNLLVYFTQNRDFYSPNAKGFFEAIMTCPTEKPGLKKTLSLLFMSLHCETVHYTARSSDAYFPAMASQFLIAQKAGISNHQLKMRDNIANDFLDPNFLLKQINDIDGSIGAWLSTLNKDQYAKAAMYFFFDYLPVLGQLSYLDGVDFQRISQGVKACCQAFASKTQMGEREVKCHHEAICKRIALVSHDLSIQLKISPLDLVDPAFSCQFKKKDYHEQFHSLAKNESNDCSALLGEALGRYIKGIPKMPDLLVKTGILNTHFSKNEVLLIALNYCDSKFMIDSFLTSSIKISQKDYKYAKSILMANMDKHLEMALQLKLVESILQGNELKKIPKLPFLVKDKSLFIQHLTRNNKALNAEAATLLNLSIHDIHYIKPSQHAKFKRLILSHDLEL
jgi:hypothetical protein